MLSVRRSLALGALLGLLIVSAPLFGEGGSATSSAGHDAVRGAVQPHAAQWLAPNVGKRLAHEPVLTYDTSAGERYFAWQLQPRLEGKITSPRDYLVLVDTTASQAGPTYLASRLLVAQLTRSLGRQDRMTVWTVNDQPTELTSGWLSAGDPGLKAAVEKLDKVTPLGAADLKAALTKAVGAFENQAGRHQVIFYIGDGMSTLNPFTAAEREQVAANLVERRVQFFPILLGGNVEVLDASALAVLTGGVVLRLADDANPLRTIAAIQDTMNQPVLYPEKWTIGGGVTEHYPTRLPPLRSDVSTLVIGKLDKAATTVRATIAGQLLGRASEVTLEDKVAEPMLECFFLVAMVKQWAKAQDKPALMQADYSLAFAFNQSHTAKQELLVQGRQALEFQRLDDAARLFQQARDLDPRDVEAEAGLKLVAGLQKAVKQGPEKADPPAEAKPNQDDELLRRAQQRQQIEEQRLRLLVDETIRQARKELTTNPSEAVTRLKLLADEVRGDANISDDLRKRLSAQIENDLRTAQMRAERFAIEQAERDRRLAEAKERQLVLQQQADREQRIRNALRQFDNLIQQARLEEAYLQAETARLLAPDNVAANIAVQQSAMAYVVDRDTTVQRQKASNFLATMYEVDLSHRPTPDTPSLYYPEPGDPFFRNRTFKTWGELATKRTKRWGTARWGEPNAEASDRIQDVLNRKTNKFSTGLQPLALEEQLAFIALAFPDVRLTILIDEKSFKAEQPDLDIAKREVSLRPMSDVSLATVLLSLLSQLDPPATYVIRGDHLEITTVKRVMRDPSKPIVAYPILDLITLGGVGQMMGGGGMMMGMGGMGGMMGMGGMGGMGGMMGMGGMGGMMGMMGMGGGMMGMMGMGGGMMGMMGMGGMGGMMGMGGMGGMMGMMGMGGMGGMMGMGGMGGMMGMGGMGGMGGMMGMGGGIGGMPPPAMSSFFSRAMNADTLMRLIANVVDNSPNTWRVGRANSQAMQGGGALGGGAGAGAGFGGGAQEPPEPTDPLETDTLDYYDPTFSLVVKAPSLRNPRTSGGRLGAGGSARGGPGLGGRDVARGNDGTGGSNGGNGASKPASGGNNPPASGSASNNGNNNQGGGQVAGGPPAKSRAGDDLDPKTAWENALAQSTIPPGMMIAAAAFLTERGQYEHAAELLKAALRLGVHLRPWFFEALALNLELANGDPAEIERALLSAADLNPSSSSGYLAAARAMNQHRKWQRALVFCRKAAAQQPGNPLPYVEALTAAVEARDAAAATWAAQNLLACDWPAGAVDLHGLASSALSRLSAVLAKEGRGLEAERLAGLANAPRQRDLVVRLTWQGDADFDLLVQEPVGTVCSYRHRQSPGGGTLQSDNSASNRTQTYSAAVAYSGEYRLTVRRAWGRSVGGKATVEIVQHAGTPREHIRRETLTVDNEATLTVKLDGGRRTELADVPPPDCYEQLTAMLRPVTTDARESLQNLATPVLAGTAGYIQVDLPEEQNPLLRAVQRSRAPSRQLQQGVVTPTYASGMALNARRVPSADGRSVRVELQPVFLGSQAVMTAKFPMIPGGQ